GAGDTITATFNDDNPATTVTGGVTIDCHIDVRLKDYRIQGGTCDSDPFLDAGETGTLVVTLTNLEVGGTLEGAQFTLASNNANVTINSPVTQTVLDGTVGGDVVLRYSLTASAGTPSQQPVTYTLTGGGPAYGDGMDPITFTDNLEADLVEV